MHMQSTGFTGQQQSQTMTGQGVSFGAHEVLMTHEMLGSKIDCINMFELYRTHVKDAQLMNILDNQLQHMRSGYQNIVNYLHNKGGAHAVPYRTPAAKNPMYGLRSPASNQPNSSVQQMDDRDVASGMLSSNKSGAIMATSAALECADPALRQMMVGCVQSAANQAYEVFQYMNQKGYYQVPTLADNTTRTMMNIYQSGSMGQGVSGTMPGAMTNQGMGGSMNPGMGTNINYQ